MGSFGSQVRAFTRVTDVLVELERTSPRRRAEYTTGLGREESCFPVSPPIASDIASQEGHEEQVLFWRQGKCGGERENSICAFEKLGGALQCGSGCPVADSGGELDS